MNSLVKGLWIILGIVLSCAVILSSLRVLGLSADELVARAFEGQTLSLSERDDAFKAESSPTRDWLSALRATPTPPAPIQVVPANVTQPLTRTVPSAGPTRTSPDTPTRQVAHPTATGTPAPAGGAVTPRPINGLYVVQAGDSLAGIAAKYDTTVEKILKANGLNQRQFIWLGQHLYLPDAENAVRTHLAAPETVGTPVVAMGKQKTNEYPPTPYHGSVASAVLYTVKPGDTLAKIADTYGTSVDEIVMANSIPDSNRIEPGDVFAIPSHSDERGRSLATADARSLTPEPNLIPTLTVVATTQLAGPNLSGKTVFQTAMGGDIYIVRADGSELTRLTNGMEPSLSPDGKWVAFTRWGENEGIYKIETDGTGEQLVYRIHQPRQVTWSPNGDRLAFAFQKGSRDLESHDKEGKLYRYTEYFWRVAMVDIDGNTLSELPSSSNQSFSPTWSPDGLFVAFSGGEGLLVGGPDGFYRELTHGAWYDSPAWSPRGGYLAYMLKRQDHFDLFLRVLQDEIVDEQPFLKYNKGIDQIALTSPPLFADVPPNNVCPAWSPDGKHIAFLSDRDGRWEIYVMDADGGNQRKMFDSATSALDINYEFARDRTLFWGK